MSAQDQAAYEAGTERSLDVTCLMLASMVPKLQKQFMDMEAFHIFAQLQAMFLKQARNESFETIKTSYFVCSKSWSRQFPLNQRNRFLWFRKGRMPSRKRGSQRNSLITKARAKRLPKQRCRLELSPHHICFSCNKKGHWKLNC